MPSYDSIVVGEDWISEHYFTTDSPRESFQGKVIELRKQWDAEAAEGRDTVRRRLLASAGELQTVLSTLAENPDGSAAAHTLTRIALGFPEPLADYTGQRAGTELRLPLAQLAGLTSTLFLQAAPVETIDDLLDPETGLLLHAGEEDNKPIASVSKAVSAAFRADEPPAFVVVQAGQWVLLAEAQRWAEGRYLAVDLLVVTERREEKRGGELDRTAAILGRQALVPDADGNIWWSGVLEDSVKHTVGVSKDLREGIRLSIEIIANDVVRRRTAKDLPLDQIDAQQLAKHALRFLYRILFLLYAEASPELRVLPSGAPEYGEGYGLDRLRELTLTELVSPTAKSGTHLYQSLATLFRLVDRGHAPLMPDIGGADDPAPGLEFNALRADLFDRRATALIDEVGLSNEATQRVLQHLLLSKESKSRKGSDRGFISYAELGINQLGAVYEGLMSYTGFFAEEDLYEVAKNGDAEKGSWVVPVTRADHLSESDFVMTLDEATGERIPVVHAKGTFVFRLAGRERQQSASYYTPEVLTKFVVSQALEELLDQNDVRTTPEQILGLTICEPALGSGAFAIEAVRQLAAETLWGFTLRRLTLADARVWIEDALNKPTLAPETDTWPLYHALVQWLIGRLPEGGEHRSPAGEWESSEKLCDRFFATSSAAPFVEPSHRELLLELFETGTGDPLRWSVPRVEQAIGGTSYSEDSIPLEVALDAPDLLRAFIPYAHAQSGIRDELTSRTLAMIDALRSSYKREVLRHAKYWGLDDAV